MMNFLKKRRKKLERKIEKKDEMPSCENCQHRKAKTGW